MIIPAKHFENSGKNQINRNGNFPPSRHTHAMEPSEGEYVITKDSPNSPDWYLAQIEEVLVDRIKISYHTTSTPALPNYVTASPASRRLHIGEARYLRTWITPSTGLPTTEAPRTSRIHRKLYFGAIPRNELDNHLLVKNVSVSSKGQLSPDTTALAAALALPHHLGAGGNDDFIVA